MAQATARRLRPAGQQRHTGVKFSSAGSIAAGRLHVAAVVKAAAANAWPSIRRNVGAHCWCGGLCPVRDTSFKHQGGCWRGHGRRVGRTTAQRVLTAVNGTCLCTQRTEVLYDGFVGCLAGSRRRRDVGSTLNVDQRFQPLHVTHCIRVIPRNLPQPQCLDVRQAWGLAFSLAHWFAWGTVVGPAGAVGEAVASGREVWRGGQQGCLATRRSQSPGTADKNERASSLTGAARCSEGRASLGVWGERGRASVIAAGLPRFEQAGCR